MIFGRNDDEWAAIVEVTIDFLKAKARRRQLSTYTQVNAAIGQSWHRMFDFTDPSGRNAIGAVLGNATKQTIKESGAMLSSIVYYLDRNDTGPGFFALAVELGLLANTASNEEKLAFWTSQVKRIHNFYQQSG